ncbi:MAG: pseudouridine synthase [Chitinophagales bacterium]|nr:pseudouridine synthase [Chitinophagales bacterium]
MFYKPYNVLNQFSKEHPEHITLADFLKVEKDVYPVGRLDKDSEGLLILTNDKKLNEVLLHPSRRHKRTYIVQLDDDITDKAIRQVATGVDIKLNNGIYHTQPCEVRKLFKPPVLPDRNPPVRFRKEIPTSWALIELTEGKNRQVRRMFAGVGFPVLRLIRVQIEDVKLNKMQPGEYISVSKEALMRLLHLDAADLVPKHKIKPTPKVLLKTLKKPTTRRSGMKKKTDKPSAKTSVHHRKK